MPPLDQFVGDQLGLVRELVDQQARLGILVLARSLGMALCLGGLLFRHEWRLRIGIGALLALTLLGRLPPQSLTIVTGVSLPLGLVWELMLGVTLGLGATLCLWPLSLVSDLLAQFLGTPLGGESDSGGVGFGMSGRSVHLLLRALALVVFLQSNGHVTLLLACERSLRDWPLGVWPETIPFVEWLTRLLQHAAILGLSLAAPLLGACGLVSLAVALIVRWFPQFERLASLPSLRQSVCWLLLSLGIPGIVEQIERQTLAGPTPPATTTDLQREGGP